MTPFILQRVNELTKGESLRSSKFEDAPALVVSQLAAASFATLPSHSLSDIALIKHNVAVGSVIASRLSEMRSAAVRPLSLNQVAR